MIDQEATLRIPPHNTDAEQAVIAAVMLKPESIVDIELAPAMFYRREHREIWQAIRELTEQHRPADVIAIADALRSSGRLEDAGGTTYLSLLMESYHSAANIGHYAEIVRGKAVQRHLCSLGHSLASIGYDEGDTLEKVNRAQALISEFSETLVIGASDQPLSVDECMRETINTLQTNWSNGGNLLGLSTGFSDLDKRTHGLRRGDMIVIAGRPSQGKTTLAMNIAENVALSGGFVLAFCLDMPRDALMVRMISSVGRIDHGRLQSGQMSDDEFSRVSSGAARLKGRALYIDDRTSLTSAQILSRARRIAHKIGRKPDLVVVDYLQQLADKGDGTERITLISRNLKNMARELDCPALILSQLNRGVESRNDKRPLMSDLRESGAIEQDADIILMMYRDEYYYPESMYKGLAEVICRKYRNGQIGTDILSSANLNMCRFDNSAIKFINPQTQQKKGGFSHYADD
jgi:replicative DNA helicase